jgi:hypothetical protein
VIEPIPLGPDFHRGSRKILKNVRGQLHVTTIAIEFQHSILSRTGKNQQRTEAHRHEQPGANKMETGRLFNQWVNDLKLAGDRAGSGFAIHGGELIRFAKTRRKLKNETTALAAAQG